MFFLLYFAIVARVRELESGGKGRMRGDGRWEKRVAEQLIEEKRRVEE